MLLICVVAAVVQSTLSQEYYQRPAVSGVLPLSRQRDDDVKLAEDGQWPSYGSGDIQADGGPPWRDGAKGTQGRPSGFYGAAGFNLDYGASLRGSDISDRWRGRQAEEAVGYTPNDWSRSLGSKDDADTGRRIGESAGVASSNFLGGNSDFPGDVPEEENGRSFPTARNGEERGKLLEPDHWQSGPSNAFADPYWTEPLDDSTRAVPAGDGGTVGWRGLQREPADVFLGASFKYTPGERYRTGEKLQGPAETAADPYWKDQAVDGTAELTPVGGDALSGMSGYSGLPRRSDEPRESSPRKEVSPYEPGGNVGMDGGSRRGGQFLTNEPVGGARKQTNGGERGGLRDGPSRHFYEGNGGLVLPYPYGSEAGPTLQGTGNIPAPMDPYRENEREGAPGTPIRGGLQGEPSDYGSSLGQMDKDSGGLPYPYGSEAAPTLLGESRGKEGVSSPTDPYWRSGPVDEGEAWTAVRTGVRGELSDYGGGREPLNKDNRAPVLPGSYPHVRSSQETGQTGVVLDPYWTDGQTSGSEAGVRKGGEKQSADVNYSGPQGQFGGAYGDAGAYGAGSSVASRGAEKTGMDSYWKDELGYGNNGPVLERNDTPPATHQYRPSKRREAVDPYWVDEPVKAADVTPGVQSRTVSEAGSADPHEGALGTPQYGPGSNQEREDPEDPYWRDEPEDVQVEHSLDPEEPGDEQPSQQEGDKQDVVFDGGEAKQEAQESAVEKEPGHEPEEQTVGDGETAEESEGREEHEMAPSRGKQRKRPKEKKVRNKRQKRDAKGRQRARRRREVPGGDTRWRSSTT